MEITPHFIYKGNNTMKTTLYIISKGTFEWLCQTSDGKRYWIHYSWVENESSGSCVVDNEFLQDYNRAN